MSKLKLAVAFPLVGKSEFKYEGLLRRMKRAARNQFDGVELHIDQPRNADTKRIKNLARTAKLEIAAIGTGMTYTKYGLSLLDDRIEIRRAAYETTRQYIKLGSELGAGVVLALIRGRYSARSGRAKAEERLSRVLRVLALYAETRKVSLFLEPINRYELNLIHTLTEATEMIKKSGASGIRILADTFHMNIEESSFVKAIRASGRHIGHVHLADCNRGAPGQGHIDFRGILNALKASGYAGWVSAEIVFKPDEARALAQTSRTVRPLL